MHSKEAPVAGKDIDAGEGKKEVGVTLSVCIFNEGRCGLLTKR